MKGYFVTGTDTNVGKTHVTCALARRAVARGHKVFAFKPLETGCARGPEGSYVGADQELLCAAAGGWQTGLLRGVHRFPLPAAPLVAAEHAGSAVDLRLVEHTLRGGAAQATMTIVEGAGGWRVPITPTIDMAALARQIGLPLIIVARAGLGTINHSLLTIEAAEREGVPVASLVLSQRETDDPEATHSNRAEIRRRWGGSILVLGLDEAALDPLVPALPQ